MKREEVQKRVLQNGEMLSLDKFNWDEKSKVYITTEKNLVLKWYNV
jgi:ActR/RegA family two-component response regulator